MARKKSSPKQYGMKTEAPNNKIPDPSTVPITVDGSPKKPLRLESFPERYRDSLRKMQVVFPNGDLVDFMVVLVNAAQGDVDAAVQYFARNYVWIPAEKKYKVQHGPEAQILNEAQRISARTRSTKRDSPTPQSRRANAKQVSSDELQDENDEVERSTVHRRQTRSTAIKTARQTLFPGIHESIPSTRKRTRYSAREVESLPVSDGSPFENQRGCQQFLRDQSRSKRSKRAQEEQGPEANARKRTRHSFAASDKQATEEQPSDPAVEPANLRVKQWSKYGSPERRVDMLKQSAVNALRKTQGDTPEDWTIFSAEVRDGRPPKHPNLRVTNFPNADASPQAVLTPISIPSSTQIIPDSTGRNRGRPRRYPKGTPTNFQASSNSLPDATSNASLLMKDTLNVASSQSAESLRHEEIWTSTRVPTTPGRESLNVGWANFKKFKFEGHRKEIEDCWGHNWEDRFFNIVISGVDTAQKRAGVRGITRKPMSLAFIEEVHRLATGGVDLEKLAHFLAENYVSTRTGVRSLGIRYYLTVTDLAYAVAHIEELLMKDSPAKPALEAKMCTVGAANSSVTPPASPPFQSVSVTYESSTTPQSQRSTTHSPATPTVDAATSPTPPSTDISDGFAILDPFIITTPTPTPPIDAHPLPSILLPQYLKTTTTLAALGRKVIITLATKPYTCPNIIALVRNFFILCERTMRCVYDVFVINFQIVMKELEKGKMGMAELASAIEGIVLNEWETILGIITREILLTLEGEEWKVELGRAEEKVVEEGNKGVALVEAIVRVGGVGKSSGIEAL